MVARVLLCGLLGPCGAWADTAPSFESKWIEARNAIGPDEPYPAGFALSPEQTLVPTPKPEWTFWETAWTSAARDWTRGLYVALKLTRDGHSAAAHNEIPHLARVLARVNLAANHTHADRVLVHAAVDCLVIDGLREAARAAGVVRGLAQPRYLDIVSGIAERVRSDEGLRAVTSEVKAMWARHDGSAHHARDRQSIVFAALAGTAAWEAAQPMGYATSLVLASLAFGSAAVAGIKLECLPLPLTFGRFHWRENFVRGPAGRCEDLLVNERVCGH